MICIQDNSLCSGCHACAQACPKSCISMRNDAEGFWYPAVNTSVCIDCGRCEAACPILTSLPKPSQDAQAFAAYNKDETVRLQSSSGGIFTLLAESVIRQGGVVFGAAYNDNFDVEHIAVDSKDKLNKLRGSKYVQSRIGDCYRRAKAYLDQGRLVLFTGTPCQIAGLLSFLGKEYDNLFTQDFICHGVPSPMVWRRYVQYREKKAASKTRRTFSRHKKYGWKMFSVSFEFSNDTEYIQVFPEDLYMTSFLRNWSLRPSCYNCHFKGVDRHSDITLADFWGVENVMPEMDDDKGCSLVLTHTDKGLKLFEALKTEMVISEVNIDSALKANPSAVSSCKMPPARGYFLKKIVHQNFEKTVFQFANPKPKGWHIQVFVEQIKLILRKLLGEKGVLFLKRLAGR